MNKTAQATRTGMWLLLAMLFLCTPGYGQDTVQTSWSYAVPSTIRHTSVRGERIGIGLDSTLIVIDRSNGTEIYHIATQRGVIEGIGLMPGDTTCVMVCASRDTVNKVVVNAVVEVDLRNGTELRRVNLATVQQQAWVPKSVQTVCAFTHNGRWLYTSTPSHRSSEPYYVENGRFQSVDLAAFTVTPTGTGVGPYGQIELSSDDRILMYWGETGWLNTDPRDTRWERSNFGLIRIDKDTGVYWKTIYTRVGIAPNARYFYDKRQLFDTISFAPSDSPELLGAINLRALCHNGKNYYSYPYKSGPDSSTITIRELGTNKIVNELLYDTLDRSYQWFLHLDDSLFIIVQQRHITCWSVSLESELPARIIYTAPDTITMNTCVPVTVKALPIGFPLDVVTSVTNGSLAYGAVQFTALGEQTMTFDLIANGEVRSTDTHHVVVEPLVLHPNASWGMKLTGMSYSDTVYTARITPDGRFAAIASRKWLATGATNGTSLHSIRFDTAQAVIGMMTSPDGNAYIVRDSLGAAYWDSRGRGTQYIHYRFDGLLRSGERTTTLWRIESRSTYSGHALMCGYRWDAVYGWISTKMDTENGTVYSFDWFDASTNTAVDLKSETQHRPYLFDRDPTTNKMWWVGMPTGAPWNCGCMHAFRQNVDGSTDSIRFEATKELRFVAGGEYLLVDGLIYNRSWQKVGPDTTLPLFKGPFLGNRRFALETTQQTPTLPCKLLVRAVPEGTVIDSFAFDVQIQGVDTDESGTTIALTFRDGTLQVFATDTLFSQLPIVKQDTIDSGKGLMVSPHPVVEECTITFDRWNELQLGYVIHDLQGVALVHGTVEVTSNTIYWDRRDDAAQRLSSGLYLLSISDGFTVMRSLVVVE